MNLIVFDLEWNQPLPHASVDDELQRSLPFEVIEIGAVRFDRGLNKTGEFSAQIKPQYYTKINPFIAKVTGLKTADLKRGEPFNQAVDRFLAFCGDDPLFLSWSPSDPFVFLQNLQHFKAEKTESIEALDLQMFFQMKIEPDKLGQQRSLESTLELLDLKKPEAFHTAFDDAVGTADVLTYLKKEHLTADLLDYKVSITTVQSVSEPFPAQLIDKSLKKALDQYASHCPLCDRALTVLPVHRASRYQARRMSACEVHGLIRETISRPNLDEPAQHNIRFMFVGAKFLALRKKKKTPQAASDQLPAE
ncbi:MAG TPA: exonuclease domain-containing protein [Fastidiosipila sp.]|nr:exonuclease domain-containing protein [Fastidiosipila sp.]